MIDIYENNIKPFSEFKLWFAPQYPDCTVFNIYKVNEDGTLETEPIGDISVNGMDCRNTPTDILDLVYTEWNNFKTRPEFFVYELRHLNPEDFDKLDKQAFFDTLLIGVALIRLFRSSRSDPDVALPVIKKCTDWLHTTDFYRAPASSVYHECYAGGLIDHTLTVAMNIAELRHAPNFKDVRIEDAVLVALVHDWCKIGYYEPYQKNVQNEQTGQWEKVDAFRRSDALIPLGHGVASMFLARCYFRLSVEESLAIRWHMGEYNVAPNEMNELHQANEKYPLVQLIQFADRLAVAAY